VQALGRIDFEDLQAERSYSGARAYNQSKLANVLFTYELARKRSYDQAAAAWLWQVSADLAEVVY